jgi:hypothetical protein
MKSHRMLEETGYTTQQHAGERNGDCREVNVPYKACQSSVRRIHANHTAEWYVGRGLPLWTLLCLKGD